MNKIYYLGIIIILLVLPKNLFSQSVNTSIILEESLLLTKRYHENESNRRKTEFYPLGIYFGVIFYPSQTINIELRPGYVSAGDNFSGFDFNLIIRRKLINELFSIGGRVNVHYNMGSHHGVLSEEYIVDDWFLNLGLGIDYALDKRLLCELYYIYNIEDYYGYSSSFNYNTSEHDKFDTHLLHTIKIGFRYIF